MMTATPLVLVPALFVPAFAVLHLAAWMSFRASQLQRAIGNPKSLRRAA